MLSDDNLRAKLGIGLIISSALFLIILAIFIIHKAPESETKDVAQLLLTSLLPLFATWVGTVLAFYYSKENFQVATDLAKSARPDFNSKRTNKIMMPIDRIIFVRVKTDLKDVLLSDVAAKFDSVGANEGRIGRLHFFDDNNRSIAVLHRSIWTEMLLRGLEGGGITGQAGQGVAGAQADQGGAAAGIAAQRAAGPGPAAASANTLQSLISLKFVSDHGTTYRDFIVKTRAFVREGSALSEAKAAMEAIKGCQDVLVTQSGSPTEAVLGWVSNVDIARESSAS